jgi:hypothetical protein
MALLFFPFFAGVVLAPCKGTYETFKVFEE